MQIPGCTEPLTKQKAYNAVHRVCDMHMRSLVIDMDGVETRFCQQCGKFEPVDRFEGTKRLAPCDRLVIYWKHTSAGINVAGMEF